MVKGGGIMANQENRCICCGAKKITSKAGNLYCPNICWKKEDNIDTDAHNDWGNRDG